VPEQFIPGDFPKKGVDKSRGFERQYAGTTPLGSNVQVYEPGSDRARGGSRPGLAALTGRIPTNAELQDLDVVVDPNTDALLDNFDDPSPNAVDDPSDTGPPSSWSHQIDPVTGLPVNTRNPGRLIRLGGSGRQPNKNKKKTYPLVVTANDQTKTKGQTFVFTGSESVAGGLVGGDTISSVAMSSAGSPSGAAVGTYPIVISGVTMTNRTRYRATFVPGTMTVNPAGIAFKELAGNPGATWDFSSVAVGDLLIMWVTNVGPGPPPAPTDTMGNAWIEATSQFDAGFGSPATNTLQAVYYAYAIGAGACSVTPDASCAGVEAFSYSGVLNGAAPSTSATSVIHNGGMGGGTFEVDWSPVAVGTPLSIVIAIMANYGFNIAGPTSTTILDGFTTRLIGEFYDKIVSAVTTPRLNYLYGASGSNAMIETQLIALSFPPA
jgi:hypothetical protein